MTKTKVQTPNVSHIISFIALITIVTLVNAVPTIIAERESKLDNCSLPECNNDSKGTNCPVPLITA
jgi:hypothetical protein